MMVQIWTRLDGGAEDEPTRCKGLQGMVNKIQLCKTPKQLTAKSLKHLYERKYTTTHAKSIVKKAISKPSQVQANHLNVTQ